nr:hypothetical protein [Tanacetum cinerariifolium]
MRRGDYLRSGHCKFILTLVLHTDEERAEDGFQAYWLRSERVIPDKRDLKDYLIEISSDRDFVGGQAPEKVTRVDNFYLRSMDRGTANVSYLLVWCLFWHAERRKSGARLNISKRIADMLAWLALGPDRQPDDAAGAPKATEDAPTIHEGALVNPTPIQSRFATWMISCMTQLMDASGCTYQDFDNTLVGSSQLPYQRHTRRRTDDANTSAPQQADL